jgi:hypothetical protein
MWRATAGLVKLNRRTFHAAIAAENTAVPIQWFESGFTIFAHIKMHTGVNRHFFFLPVTASRAGNN